MTKLNNLIFNLLLFLHPLELLKKFIKIIVVSREIILERISYYPNSVKSFETEFANYIGRNFGLSFSNGTSSIEAALFALDIKAGDEVIVPSCTFHASIGPIINCGAVPIFVDVEKDSLCPGIEEIASKKTDKTKCILLVHPFGLLANMQQICDFANLNNLKLIEDVSHAHGAKIGKRMAGSFADISCFSLQGAKAIAAGEGGIAVTDSPLLFARMSMYGHFDRHKEKFAKADKKYIDTGVGHKMRAHPLGIVLARVDLMFNDFYNRKMSKNNIYIKDILSKFDFVSTFKENVDSQSGGFFGGLPLIIDPKYIDIEDVVKIFQSNALNVIRYPWPMHHKLALFNEDKLSSLTNTEFLRDNMLLLDRRILFFLPFFKKRNLRRTLRMLDELSKS